MKLAEVLKDLKKKKTDDVCLCLHPDHPAVLEIIRKDELDKWGETEGGYVVLRTLPGRGEAMELVQDALLYAYRKDPSMQSVKENVREFFETDQDLPKEEPEAE